MLFLALVHTPDGRMGHRPDLDVERRAELEYRPELLLRLPSPMTFTGFEPFRGQRS